MPHGTSWNITPNRKVMIMDMLKRQHTIGSIATNYGVNVKTITKALKKAKIDHKAVRLSGIADVKATMFKRLELIDKDKDYVDASMKVLDRYDNTDDTTTGSSTAAKSTKDIAAKILEELQDV